MEQGRNIEGNSTAFNDPQAKSEQLRAIDEAWDLLTRSMPENREALLQKFIEIVESSHLVDQATKERYLEDARKAVEILNRN